MFLPRICKLYRECYYNIEFFFDLIVHTLKKGNFPTAGPIFTKLGRNVPLEVFFKDCSQNMIPSKTLVAMATKRNSVSNSLKIFFSGTAGQTLK